MTTTKTILSLDLEVPIEPTIIVIVVKDGDYRTWMTPFKTLEAAIMREAAGLAMEDLFATHAGAYDGRRGDEAL